MDLTSKMMELSTKAKILVLFANAYSMNDDNGRHMSGCTVHYMFWGENGEQLLPQSVWDPNKPVGIQRAKCSIAMELREKIPVAPAIYEGDFLMSVGGDGKPVLKLQDVAYVSNVEFKEKIIPGLVIPGMVVPEAAQPDAAVGDAAPADASKNSKTANK